MKTMTRNMILAALASAAMFVAAVDSHAQARTTLNGSWQEVFRVDEEHGALLYNPQAIHLGPKFIVLYDYEGQQLHAFSFEGKELWKAGRKGAGPGEFANPTGLAVDLRGNTYVYDPSNARISVFSESGKLVRSIPIENRLYKIVVRNDGTIVASPMADSLSLLVKYRADGGLAGGMALPADMKALSILVRDGRILLTETDEVIVLHSFATRMLAVRGSDMQVVRTGELLNAQPFPAIQIINMPNGMVGSKRDPSAKQILRAAATNKDTILVVDNRGGKGPLFIDAYSSSSLKYINSRPAPDRIIALAVRGDMAYGLVTEPLPALVAWRWKASN